MKMVMLQPGMTKKTMGREIRLPTEQRPVPKSAGFFSALQIAKGVFYENSSSNNRCVSICFVYIGKLLARKRQRMGDMQMNCSKCKSKLDRIEKIAARKEGDGLCMICRAFEQVGKIANGKDKKMDNREAYEAQRNLQEIETEEEKQQEEELNKVKGE